MFRKEDCYLAGTFIKTHGVEGELILKKNSDLLERYKMESVLVDIDGGLVPFFISPNGFHVRNHNSLRLKFDDIDSEAKALRFIGCQVYVLIEDAPDVLEEEEFDLDLLIGFHILDEQHGDLGPIEDIQDYSGNIVFQLTIKEQEVLIPFAEANLLEIDEQKKTISLNLPDGLLDIYFE
ncbi:MAG: ribosome maturation factor RimM [Marinifilaceae bacterium]